MADIPPAFKEGSFTYTPHGPCGNCGAFYTATEDEIMIHGWTLSKGAMFETIQDQMINQSRELLFTLKVVKR